jgi:hypothetical protein
VEAHAEAKALNLFFWHPVQVSMLALQVQQQFTGLSCKLFDFDASLAFMVSWQHQTRQKSCLKFCSAFQLDMLVFDDRF